MIVVDGRVQVAVVHQNVDALPVGGAGERVSKPEAHGTTAWHRLVSTRILTLHSGPASKESKALSHANSRKVLGSRQPSQAWLEVSQEVGARAGGDSSRRRAEGREVGSRLGRKRQEITAQAGCHNVGEFALIPSAGDVRGRSGVRLVMYYYEHTGAAGR